MRPERRGRLSPAAGPFLTRSVRSTLKTNPALRPRLPRGLEPLQGVKLALVHRVRLQPQQLGDLGRGQAVQVAHPQDFPVDFRERVDHLADQPGPLGPHGRRLGAGVPVRRDQGRLGRPRLAPGPALGAERLDHLVAGQPVEPHVRRRPRVLLVSRPPAVGGQEHLLEEFLGLLAGPERELDPPADHGQELAAMLVPRLAQGGQVGDGRRLRTAGNGHGVPRGERSSPKSGTGESGPDLTRELAARADAELRKTPGPSVSVAHMAVLAALDRRIAEVIRPERLAIVTGVCHAWQP